MNEFIVLTSDLFFLISLTSPINNQWFIVQNKQFRELGFFFN